MPAATMRRASGRPPEKPPHLVTSGCSTASARSDSAASNIAGVTMFSPPARGIGAASASRRQVSDGASTGIGSSSHASRSSRSSPIVAIAASASHDEFTSSISSQASPTSALTGRTAAT